MNSPSPFAISTPISDRLLTVSHLSKDYSVRSGNRVIRAVDDVSFTLRRGETLGLVGESGSGKTTTARCIVRAITPTRGTVLFRPRSGGQVDLASMNERDLRPLRRELQMVFQDPQSSLDPRMTVREIVGEPLVVHRLASGDDLRERVAEALIRVGMKTEHMDRFPAAFSTGQRQRIGIARALIMRPSLIVADEPVSTLDVSVQAQVLNLLKDLQQEVGLTYLFVAHNLDVVRHFCDRVAVMYAGRVIEIADTATLFASPKHPYTKALLRAAPNPDPDVKIEDLSVGEPPDLGNLPVGCAFRPRCPFATARCDEVRPEPRAVAKSTVACHVAE